MKTARFMMLVLTAFTLAVPGAFAANAAAGAVSGDVANAIQHVADRYADAAKGYSDAAERADDKGLQSTLKEKAEQRQQFRRDLLTKAGLWDEKAQANGSLEGAAHRAWLNAKAAVTGKNDLAIVKTIRSGEEEAVKSFSDLLGQPLPADIRDTVQDQYENVVESYAWATNEVIERTDERLTNKMENKTDELKNEAENTGEDWQNKAQDAGDETEDAMDNAKENIQQ